MIYAFLGLILSACLEQSSQPTATEEWIKVFKHTGAIQCEKEGVALEVMQKQLEEAGIHVNCAQRSYDGMMRPAMCGAGTSDINVYQIPKQKLPYAKQLAFKSVGSLKGFQDQSCAEK